MNDFQRRALEIAKNSSYLADSLLQGREPLAIDAFFYNVRIGTAASPIANGAAAQGIVQIQSDSYFVVNTISSGVFDAGGAVIATPNVQLQITDTGSGKTFFSEQTLLPLVSGGSGFPFLLSTPRVLPPNVNVKFDVVNNTGAASTGILISLQGARIYYAG